MAVRDVPKIKGLIWSSLPRQLPVVRLHYKLGDIERRGLGNIKQGKVEKATSVYAEIMEGTMAFYVNAASEYGARTTRSYKAERSAAQDAWENYIKKNPKANDPDSIASFVFRYQTWTDFFNDFTLRTNYNNAYYNVGLETQLYRIIRFCNIMKQEFKTDVDLLVVSGNDSYDRNDIFSVADLSILVRVNEYHTKYFSFADNLDYQNTIPYQLQGATAKVFPFDMKGMFGIKMLHVDEKESSIMTLPATDYKNNFKSEVITVKTDVSDLQVLHVSRKVSVKGSLKKDEQAALTIFEEMALQAGEGAGYPDDLIKRNKDRSKSARENEADLQTLLEKARTKHKEDFENEIERNYDVKAKELKQYKILNLGAGPSPFEYEQEFIMEGWVKKAGNNYIIDMGKFISSQIAIEKDQRKERKMFICLFPAGFLTRLNLLFLMAIQ
ncbi:MAG: hypothetical protein WDN26_14635 [Chitinophagaceae bacterium]